MMKLNLSRRDVCDLKLALTSLICSMRDEMREESTPEYRRTTVLPASIAKWEKLRDEIKRQFDEQDID